MAPNLKNRLRLIRESRPVKPGAAGGKEAVAAATAGPSAASGDPAATLGALAQPDSPALPGWTSAGYQTLMRTVTQDLPALPSDLPRALGILAPDLLRYAALTGGAAGIDMPAPENLLFFDLETTGLSGGAGTVAFLAAFGRFVKTGAVYSLVTTQYLLLDYPGEPEFLEAVLGEIGANQAHTTHDGRTNNETGFNKKTGKPPLVVSYNGKSFDSQILRNRCLMNGLIPLELHQADLLHPARRLWKRLLPSCSQGEIESSVLGLDRSGDIPGALAPDIWFSFLKNGETGDLLGICDHNLRDIRGLASLFIALTRLATDPRGETLRHDSENLALWWRRMVRLHGEAAFGEGAAETGEALLARAAEAGHPRAAHAYYRKLAIDAEWKRKDYDAALGYVDTFLALEEIQDSIRGEMNCRRERLLEKLKKYGGSHEYTDSDH
ncbi:YprB [Treponema primitia ZAS-2]|uniref:YprB n=1 Tax=Treponema primitia (strain ATCC BAA-887 / DSM 12427 / ZAS-2) TaxID=545694 RepID=F5YLW4_TREPZ|nr:ribonuclease H-like domain-containing protein [Treponema primitia]AEF83695.1 YprB [Treponema primitia ZAS-2]